MMFHISYLIFYRFRIINQVVGTKWGYTNTFVHTYVFNEYFIIIIKHFYIEIEIYYK
jgi:hypothetical protein